MGRKNIFDILKEKFDLREEISRLETLAKMYIVEVDDFYNHTLKTFIDEFCLSEWKSRIRIISYDDFRSKLDITEFQMSQRPSREQMLRYLEFMANMIYLCQKGFDIVDEYTEAPAYFYIIENLQSIAENMNFEFKLIEEKEQVLLIEKNAAAIAAAEIIEPEFACDVIEYNHYLLKGDIDRKQKILKVLADKFESIRPQLKNIDSTLESNTGYLLNKMNIRHNNMSGTNAISYVKNMPKNELESWYDETYQLILLSILEVDNIDRNRKIKNLKQLIENPK